MRQPLILLAALKDDSADDRDSSGGESDGEQADAQQRELCSFLLTARHEAAVYPPRGQQDTRCHEPGVERGGCQARIRHRAGADLFGHYRCRQADEQRHDAKQHKADPVEREELEVRAMPAENVDPCRTDPLGPQQHPDDEGERPEGDAEENPEPPQESGIARG